MVEDFSRHLYTVIYSRHQQQHSYQRTERTKRKTEGQPANIFQLKRCMISSLLFETLSERVCALSIKKEKKKKRSAKDARKVWRNSAKVMISSRSELGVDS